MNHSPTLDEVRQLFAAADDEAGHHTLWIDKAGTVHLSLIPPTLTPLGFEQQTPSMQVRFETFDQGAGYVGKKAAADDKYMREMLTDLIRAWDPPFEAGRVKYVDD